MFYSHFQTFVYKCTHAMMGETANNLLTKKKFFLTDTEMTMTH